MDQTHADTLGDEITDWAQVWEDAAERGFADSAYGMEWRHSLQRFLGKSEQQRRDWFERPREWRVRNVHHDGGVERPFDQDQPDYATDDAMDQWLADCLTVTGSEEDTLTMGEVIASMSTWEVLVAAVDEVPEPWAGLSTVKRRELVRERLVEAGVRWSQYRKCFIGVAHRSGLGSGSAGSDR